MGHDIGIRIELSGPGGCICAEAIIVKRALEAAGIQVIVTSNYENRGDDAEIMAHFEALKDKPRVHMNVDHQPWGG